MLMKENGELIHPLLVAVWPGMGNVAINAGYYLMSKLGMHLESELSARELFEINHVEVTKGLIQPGHLPRSRFFVWRDPSRKRDLIVFLGEAQPPTGVASYCAHIIDHARALKVERVFTFAAMATQMQLGEASRVFGAATDEVNLAACRNQGVDLLQDGQISGLNGVLLGVAAERGLPGTCLLGEMPHVFVQVAYPRASLEVLKTFSTLTGIEIDLAEMEIQVEAMDKNLRLLMSRIEEAIHPPQPTEEEPSFGPPLDSEDGGASILDAEEREQIEDLFGQAEQDRSQAYRLKQELDRLKVFENYEDRFLDLFKDAGGGGDKGGLEDSAA